jgi:uncharacterized protein YwgA
MLPRFVSLLNKEQGKGLSLGKSEVRWLVRLLGISPKELVGPASFTHRLKVQKAAFLLNHLKVSPFTDYVFNYYLHGPYSPGLAKDYYHLEEVKVKTVHLDSKNMKILKWFTSKNETWLEAASSIISIKDRYADATKDEIFSTLTMSKPWINRSLFESVMTELATKGL